MSTDLATLYGMQFATNVQMLLQQKESRLRSLVSVGYYKGKQASPVDQVGAIAMKPVTTKFAPLVRTDAPVDSRWVAPVDYDLTQMVDSFEKLKIISDPQSVYVTNAHQAANRQIDDIIISAFFSSAMTGNNGATSTAFPATQQVAVNEGSVGNSGMTVAKLRAGKKILRKNEVDFDMDPITCVITAEEEDDLLAEAQVINLDYNDRPVLVEGRIQRFLGINFIHSERLGFSSGVIRSCPMWAKSGMHLGLWEDVYTKVSQRDDLSSQPWQAYVKLSAGATRLEEKKVVQILCDES